MTTEQVVYICPEMPSMGFKVPMLGEDVYIQFKAGQLIVDKPLADAMEALFAKKPSLSRGIIKTDRAAAEKLALKLQKVSGVKGGATSTNIASQHVAMEEIAVEAVAMGASEETAQAAAVGIAAKPTFSLDPK
jgi:hypothetical protein